MAHWQKTQKWRFLLLCAARYRTQAAAARPGLPCGGDLSGHLNAGASAPAGQPADTRRTPSVARSLSRSRPRRWCRPVGRRGDGRGDGRGGGRGVGLARSSAWGGRFGDVARAGSRVMRAMRALFGFGFGGSVTRGAAAAACHPKLASSCRRVAMSPLGGLGFARAGGVSRVRTMRRHPDGRTDDGGAAESPARAS